MASVLPAWQDSIGRRAAGKDVPMALWEKYGLGPQGWFQSRAAEPRYAKLPRAARLRLALEEGGGPLSLFGRFLAGRADLLPSPYLRELRKVPGPPTASPAPSLEGKAAKLLSSFQAIRGAPGPDVYTALYQSRSVVVEDYRNCSHSFDGNAWGRFCGQIRILRDGPEAAISHPTVLEQYRHWLQLQSDIERKRTILGNLQNVPANCVSRFPSLIPELQAPACLIYEGMEGSPLDKELVPDSAAGSNSLRLLVEAILEQSLLLSLIDAEIRIENFLVLPEGRLGFRSLPAWVPVPVEWHGELLQYVSSSAAGNAPRALQMLCRMSSQRESPEREQYLLNKLSALKPELKINVRTPESVSALENYWRALAETSAILPPFLQLFHRNLTLIGQWNESVAPSEDLVAESLWPVLGRIIRFHFDEILSTEKEREWMVGSGLLFLTAARQAALGLEQLRDYRTDTAAVMEIKESGSRESKRNRRTAALIHSAVALVVFLFSFQLALGPDGRTFQLFARATAVVSAIALCVFVARIE